MCQGRLCGPCRRSPAPWWRPGSPISLFPLSGHFIHYLCHLVGLWIASRSYHKFLHGAYYRNDCDVWDQQHHSAGFHRESFRRSHLGLYCFDSISSGYRQCLKPYGGAGTAFFPSGHRHGRGYQLRAVRGSHSGFKCASDQWVDYRSSHCYRDKLEHDCNSFEFLRHRIKGLTINISPSLAEGLDNPSLGIVYGGSQPWFNQSNVFYSM